MKVMATIGTSVYIRVFKIGFPWELLKGGAPSEWKLLSSMLQEFAVVSNIPIVGGVSVAKGSQENSLLQ